MTIASSRTALASAVSAAEKETQGTACYVSSGGTDWASLGGLSTSVEWQYRVMCAVGWNSDLGTMETALATLLAAKLAILKASGAYRIVNVGPATSRQIGGGDHLAADITVTAKVDI